MRVTIHYTTNQEDVFSSSETVEEIDELIRELSFIEEVVDVIEPPLQKNNKIQCEKCTEVFTTDADLHVHVETHNQESATNFEKPLQTRRAVPILHAPAPRPKPAIIPPTRQLWASTLHQAHRNKPRHNRPR
jgi:hypothetical protein